MDTGRVRLALRLAAASLLVSLLPACADASSPQSGASGQSGEPTYYVDGARPVAGWNEGEPRTSEEYQAGCVPWSKDRPTFFICGPIDDDFEPPPAPGGYGEYPGVCEAAAQVVASKAQDLQKHYDASEPPLIDVMTCGAAGLGDAKDDRWLVAFGLTNSAAYPPFHSVIVRDFSQTDTKNGPVVLLREGKWPPEG